MAEPHDVAIVGAGPAGQAAALTLAEFGARPLVLDEQPGPGGQILPSGSVSRRGVPTALLAATDRFGRSGAIDFQGGRSVVGIARTEAGFTLSAASDAGVAEIRARRVLIATGCQDLAVPVAGWTLRNVFTAGAIQTLLKRSGYLAGANIVLAGTHPLQLVLAAQIVRAGGSVGAVLFAQAPGDALATALAHSAAFAAQPGLLGEAMRAGAALRRAGVAVRFGQSLLEIHGGAAAEAVRTRSRAILCDAVGLCFGFVPQSALPRLADVRVRRAGAAGGWATVHDAWMQSSVGGLHVAGETTGVSGALAAAAEGAIAGIGIAAALGLVGEGEASDRARRHRRALRRYRRAAALFEAIADPRPYFPEPLPSTPVCRCEGVTFEAVSAAVATGESANAVKRRTRCGMGACQGRNCEPMLLRLIADAGRPDDPGFTPRFPARPVPIGDLI